MRLLMQKNKLNLHIYGIHLLNPYKTVVSHLKRSKLQLSKYHHGGNSTFINSFDKNQFFILPLRHVRSVDLPIAGTDAFLSVLLVIPVLWPAPHACTQIGSFRSHSGSCNENVTFKLNFAVGLVFCYY